MKSSLVVPFAIIAAGVIVAGSVYFYFHPKTPMMPTDTENLSVVRAVDDTDHILGNPAASVMLVEYSDIDCPFCKNFKETMEKTMATYGASGNVAWVYRHLPITDQHPNAEMHAEAAECVAAQGGTAAFFRFIDEVNDAASGTAQFDPAHYGTVIQKLGLDTTAFSTCLQNHTYQKRVADDAANAIASGAGGAPYTVLIAKGEPPVSISGAFSYEQMTQLIDAALQKAGVK